MKVLLVVTHLLGTGHLSRALTLARAFTGAGHQAVVVSGGMPAPHLETDDIALVQLPPLRSDGTNFTRLLDKNGDAATEAVLQDRRALILSTLNELNPDILITELFPFGRRNLRNEFRALLEAAHAHVRRPHIFASIRDILAPPSKPAKAIFAEDMVRQFYDAVLVHSDPGIIPLDLSWPVSEALRPALQYTGFVAPPGAVVETESAGKNDVIVSAGGGDTGTRIFECAKRAAGMDTAHQWRLLIGGKTAEQRMAALRRNAPDNLIVEPLRSDFRQLLHQAAASVSMCGYNTALDLLQTNCPAVFIPFDEGNETEQTIRAQALSKVSGVEVFFSSEMTAQTLLDRINAARAAPRRTPVKDTEGAARTVEIVRNIRETFNAL